MSARRPTAEALRAGPLFFLEKPPCVRAVLDDEPYLDNLLEVCHMSRSHLKPGPTTYVTRARPEGTDFPFTPWANDLLKSLDPTVARKIVAYEYDCGCGQTYPHDPMIGVRFENGAVEEFWSEEITFADETLTCASK